MLLALITYQYIVPWTDLGEYGRCWCYIYEFQEFIHEKYEEMVVVDSVTVGSPASIADIRKVFIIHIITGICHPE